MEIYKFVAVLDAGPAQPPEISHRPYYKYRFAGENEALILLVVYENGPTVCM